MNVALSPDRFLPEEPSAARRHATLALAAGLVAGTLTQALFWRTGVGLNFFVWDVLVVAATIGTLRRGRIPSTAWGAATACTLLGLSVAVYASEWTVTVAVPATIAILTVLPILVRDRFTLADLSRVPLRTLASIGLLPSAVGETVRLPGVAAGGDERGVLRGTARGLLIGVPTAGFFALLLASDTDFSRTLGRVRDELGDVLLFALWSVASGGGYLVSHAMHGARRRPDTEVSPVEAPYRAHLRAIEATATGPSVSVVTWAMVVAQVSLVFGLFVVANLRHLFGGNALVRERGTMTYATYLHQGFAELLFATVLSVCLVLAGHALLRPRGEEGPRGAVPGGHLLTVLEGTLLVLTGITLASCWQRLRIYEDAYGASHLRLGVAFIELGILGVLALTLAKSVFRAWNGHAGALLAFAAAMCVVASAVNTDAYVAAKNLDRAAEGKWLDADYLASLSRDARAVLDHPYVRATPELAARLQGRFCAPHTEGLRAFRGVGSSAVCEH